MPSDAEVVEDTDLWAELRECLEILTEHADALVALKSPDAELITAIHQAVELVLAMGEENDMAWASIQPLRVVINDLQRQLAERSLWTPPSLS